MTDHQPLPGKGYATTDHKPLPVKGYTAQSQARVDLVNEGKELEERVLRYIERVNRFNNESQSYGEVFGWLFQGQRSIQIGFMQVFRSVFEPQRVKLPEDAP